LLIIVIYIINDKVLSFLIHCCQIRQRKLLLLMFSRLFHSTFCSINEGKDPWIH